MSEEEDTQESSGLGAAALAAAVAQAISEGIAAQESDNDSSEEFSEGDEDGEDGEDEESDESDSDMLDLDKAIDEKASRFGMTATNVKSLMFHVLTDPRTRDMVSRLQQDEVPGANPDLVRMTRAARRQAQNSTRQTQSGATAAAMSETSDDDDFVPEEGEDRDDSEESGSDDEDSKDSDEDIAGTPTSGTLVADAAAPSLQSSPVAPAATAIASSPVNLSVSGQQSALRASSPRSPLSSLLSQPLPNISAGDELDLDLSLAAQAADQSSRDGLFANILADLDDCKPGTVGRRTRSKMPLQSTSLHDLEAVLQTAPALPAHTLAQMDTDTANYMQFLQQLQRDDVADDDDDDEYDYIADAARMKEINEEYRTDQTVQISKRELEALRAEAPMVTDVGPKKKKKRKSKSATPWDPLPEIPKEPTQCSFSFSQLQAVSCQLRMYFQLLSRCALSVEWAGKTVERNLLKNTDRVKATDTQIEEESGKITQLVADAEVEKSNKLLASLQESRVKLLNYQETTHRQADKLRVLEDRLNTRLFKLYQECEANKNQVAHSVFRVPGVHLAVKLTSSGVNVGKFQDKVDMMLPFSDQKIPLLKTSNIDKGKAKVPFRQAENVLLALALSHYESVCDGQQKSKDFLKMLQQHFIMQRDDAQLSRFFVASKTRPGPLAFAMKSGVGSAFRDQFMAELFTEYGLVMPHAARGDPTPFRPLSTEGFQDNAPVATAMRTDTDHRDVQVPMADDTQSAVASDVHVAFTDATASYGDDVAHYTPDNSDTYGAQPDEMLAETPATWQQDTKESPISHERMYAAEWTQSAFERNDLTKDDLFEEVSVPPDLKAQPLMQGIAVMGTGLPSPKVAVTAPGPPEPFVQAESTGSTSTMNSSGPSQPPPWTKDEDREILKAGQKKRPWSSLSLSQRSPEDVETRFKWLLKQYKRKRRKTK